MTDRQPCEIVDDLLDELDMPGRRNVITENPPLMQAIAYFLDQKAEGDPRTKHITLAWFYLNKLRDRFDGPVWYGTVRVYVKDFLQRDIKTGRAL